MNNGGPAFPGGHGCSSGPTVGMSLRDYFAAAALQGILSDNDSLVSLEADATEKGKKPTPWLATTCYEIADAMLAERQS